MTAAQIIHSLIMRGMNADLTFTQFAALAYLAANKSGDRASVLSGIGRSVSSTNGCSILAKLVTLGLVTQEAVPMPHGGGNAKLVFTITPAGLRLLGLKKEAASS